MRFTKLLLPSRSGNLAIFTLNNPSALNALTLDMIYSLHDALTEWHADDSVRAILTRGTGTAFCAGGDVKSLYMAGQSRDDKHGTGQRGLLTADFFRHEYSVNHMLATTRACDNNNNNSKQQPQISIWDGLVMGGGAGVSVHGMYRIATERALFAMPETGIGLFPDVGSMYWMPRTMSAGMAAYTALTGVRLKTEDLLYTGIATHYVPSNKIVELERALIEACNCTTVETNIGPVLLSFRETPPVDPLSSSLAQNQEAIDNIFGTKGKQLEEILDSLEQLHSDFGRETLATLRKQCPTSLKVTLEGLRRGAAMYSITDDLVMEYRMSQAFMRHGSNFYEGIRAALIDKDRSPKWKPATIEEVTPEMVASYFEPLSEENEWKPL
jgi:enoyl-CoA hydratase/carnithine racemase